MAILLSQKQMYAAAAIISGGGIVGIRTETVWGVASNLQSASKIFVAKNRPVDKNLVLQFASLKDVLKYFEGNISKIEQKLFKKFKSGLTIALSQNIAVRIPADPVTRKFLHICNPPLVVTSANISGQEPAKTWQQVYESLGERIDAIIVSSPCKLGTPSTIIKITNDKLEIIRQGIIPEEKIKNYLSKFVD